MMTVDGVPSFHDDRTAKDGASTRTGASGELSPIGEGGDDMCSVVTSSTYSTVQVQ